MKTLKHQLLTIASQLVELAMARPALETRILNALDKKELSIRQCIKSTKCRKADGCEVIERLLNRGELTERRGHRNARMIRIA